MGNKASKPARKLAGTLANSAGAPQTTQSKVKLPSAELKSRFESGQQFVQNSPQPEQTPAGSQPGQGDTHAVGEPGAPRGATEPVPEGKDGMDPQADPAFIRSINSLGRQIHSRPGHTAPAVNVAALKQLLSRKQLYEKGQDEVKAQLETASASRTMVHPRTLTAIVYAMGDSRVTRADIAKDYSVEAGFLERLGRFKVAENMVVLEEATKEDEIGPKAGQPMARAATEPSLMDYDGTVSESVNDERLKELKRRLE